MYGAVTPRCKVPDTRAEPRRRPRKFCCSSDWGALGGREGTAGAGVQDVEHRGAGLLGLQEDLRLGIMGEEGLGAGEAKDAAEAG